MHDAYPKHVRLALHCKVAGHSDGAIVQASAGWMMCCKHLQEGAQGPTAMPHMIMSMLRQTKA